MAERSHFEQSQQNCCKISLYLDRMILKDLDLSLGVFCIALMLIKLFDISTVLAYSSKKDGSLESCPSCPRLLNSIFIKL